MQEANEKGRSRYEKERETDRLGETEMEKRKSNNFKVTFNQKKTL